MMNAQQFLQAAEFRWGGLQEETLEKVKQMIKRQDGGPAPLAAMG